MIISLGGKAEVLQEMEAVYGKITFYTWVLILTLAKVKDRSRKSFGRKVDEVLSSHDELKFN